MELLLKSIEHSLEGNCSLFVQFNNNKLAHFYLHLRSRNIDTNWNPILAIL